MPRSNEPSAELDTAGRQLYHKIKGWITNNAEWQDSDQLLTNHACLSEQRARTARQNIEMVYDEETGETKPRYTVMGSTGSPVVNPTFRIAEQAEKAFMEALKELGLTPRARKQLKIEAAKVDGDDPFS